MLNEDTIAHSMYVCVINFCPFPLRVIDAYTLLTLLSLSAPNHWRLFFPPNTGYVAVLVWQNGFCQHHDADGVEARTSDVHGLVVGVILSPWQQLDQLKLFAEQRHCIKNVTLAIFFEWLLILYKRLKASNCFKHYKIDLKRCDHSPTEEAWPMCLSVTQEDMVSLPVSHS